MYFYTFLKPLNESHKFKNKTALLEHQTILSPRNTIAIVEHYPDLGEFSVNQQYLYLNTFDYLTSKFIGDCLRN